MITAGMTEKSLALFWAKIDKRGPDECWPWLASMIGGIAPSFKLNGRTTLALRVMWELVSGEEIPHRQVRRTCGNSRCVSPYHLSSGLGDDLVMCRVAEVVAVDVSDVELARFWGRVDKGGPDECWPWTGAVTSAETPAMRWRGRTATAMRIAWELAHDEIVPAGRSVQRTCDNKLCVNPAHLYIRGNGHDPVVWQPPAGSDLAGGTAEMLSRFWAKVERRGEHECWKWTGANNSAPVVMWGDRNTSALKIMWELERGETVPAGVQLRRTCGNLSCVNPAHLKLFGNGNGHDADSTGEDRPSIFYLAALAGCGLEPVGGGRYRVLRSADWGR